ncbi:Holliday junction resolvase RuvX [Thiorhodovibrio frisius]|uniref:Putative pre-16S rRNA nuclease n=1 Tax=Thiorhodovibrio frisius TaxID=631362 RepID=H8Z3M5_9GAMM|nr:Holliday junction resolvase RuvX [Thiorhodovibrio frisius]EIC20014.1 RNAse H-fold protein YqgF [Thiorhodovibrio frisius]WPL20743.1 Putative Holliday junction resolvase [Thiorhodovibrio frisius]
MTTPTTLFGFDFGPRKIGIAVGQTLTGTARPLTTLRSRHNKPDWTGIERLVRDWQPCAAVLGLPKRMDDTEEDWTPLVRRFGRQLEGRFGLAVHLVDERLTSRAAREELGGRFDNRDDQVDAVAAKLILETWLGEQLVQREDRDHD